MPGAWVLGARKRLLARRRVHVSAPAHVAAGFIRSDPDRYAYLARSVGRTEEITARFFHDQAEDRSASTESRLRAREDARQFL